VIMFNSMLMLSMMYKLCPYVHPRIHHVSVRMRAHPMRAACTLGRC
jgi:hypothetical protein